MKAQQAQTMQTTEGDTSLLEEILADAHAAGKDTSVLTRDERSALLVGLARKLGLNPLSGAVMFLRTNGRETLYVTKQGTDQIAARERLCRETIKGPEVVTIEGKKVVLCQVRAKHPDGREEVSTATLALADPVNDLMKCECVPLDSEILTRRGFKRHDEITVGEEVLAYDAEADRCEWVPLENVTVYPSAPVSRFATASGGFAFRCTPNHSWAVDTMGLAGRTLVEAQNVKTQYRVRIAAPSPGGDHPLTPELAAVIGWVMCDGTIKRVGRFVTLGISQSKPQRVDEIRALLARAGLHARESVGRPTVRAFPGGNVSKCAPQHWFYLNASESRDVLAAAGIEGPADMPRLAARLSQPARRAMLDAMMAADGTGGHTFGKKRKPGVMDAWQILCTLEGIALGKMGTSSIGDVPVQRMLTYDYVAGSNLTLTPDGSESVWCPTTRHGTWVMRQGGRISITGNTKAKRRATLSVCGLGLLAEDEIETIPGAQPVSLTIPTTTAPKGHGALEGFAADLDAAETVRDLRICYESLIAAMRAEGVSVEEMQPTLNDAAHQIHGALEERLGLHLAGAEMTALLGASGDVFARALDVLRVSVSRGVDAVAQWWVNSRRDLGETLGGQCYRVAQRSLADEPRDAASVKRAGASLKAAVARLDAPPPDGTSGPAKGTGNGATASASSAATEATAAPSALAAVPTWAADAASIRAHVASYTHPAAVVAGARKWGALLGDRYLRACADRLATLDPTCADHALGMVQTYAVEGPKRKAA